jgi:uncharacterized protein
VTVWADGDSLQAELRRVICRRANSEAAARAATGDEPRFRAVFVALKAPALDRGPGVELVLVPGGPGAADDRIAELASPGDIAVTRDIPLAERLVGAGLAVLNDRGELYSSENVHERRSLRDSAAELRSLGLAPPSARGRSWGPRELKAFADAFDRALARALRGQAVPGQD